MSRRRWVLKCKQCGTECVYAEIPSTGIANYFLPKKPEVPKNFTYPCPTCGHEDTYDRSDLTYQDDQISPSDAATNCSEASDSLKRAAGSK
jgi:endogenous inhibitor of DNA gyrase (YacG/DUF329 family)